MPRTRTTPTTPGPNSPNSPIPALPPARATLRGGPGVPAPSQALEVGGHVRLADDRGGR
jgi:hypothetical protein